MNNQERLDQLQADIDRGERELKWSEDELNKAPQNQKLIAQVSAHETVLKKYKQQYDKFLNDIEENEYSLTDEWYDPSEGNFENIPFDLANAVIKPIDIKKLD